MRSKTAFLLLALIPVTAMAQMAPPAPAGMHHLSVTSAEKPAPAPVVTPQTKAAPAKPETPPAPKAIKPADALRKLDTLTAWPYYSDLMTVDNDTALETVIHQVNLDPGSVPPKGLFYLAKALSDRKRFEEAAFYYYTGQLRATFDMARFPPYTPEEKVKAPDKRTDDQKGEVPGKGPDAVFVINPHEELSMLALSIGSPIARWAMSDTKRLDAVMAKVRDWDMATPYAYLPDYDTSHGVAFDTWPALLAKTRNDYFIRVRQIAQGLTAVKPTAPVPTFSRP